MKYVVIIPAYREVRFISSALDSLLSQSLQPVRIMIVDDASDDDLADMVKRYQYRSRVVELVRNPLKKSRMIGAAVVAAFQYGLDEIERQKILYDLVVKMDADLVLPVHYFETIAHHFQKTPNLGIAGGQIVIQSKGSWKLEAGADSDHVKGACKTYRAACLAQIGGLLPSIGWDTADEILAQHHGWKTFVDQELHIEHRRPMGSATGKPQTLMLIGAGMFRLRYGFLISAISALKAAVKLSPFGLAGPLIMVGWVRAWIKGDGFIVNESQGRIIRSYRLKRMQKKLYQFRQTVLQSISTVTNGFRI